MGGECVRRGWPGWSLRLSSPRTRDGTWALVAEGMELLLSRGSLRRWAIYLKPYLPFGVFELLAYVCTTRASDKVSATWWDYLCPLISLFAYVIALHMRLILYSALHVKIMHSEGTGCYRIHLHILLQCLCNVNPGESDFQLFAYSRARPRKMIQRRLYRLSFEFK